MCGGAARNVVSSSSKALKNGVLGLNAADEREEYVSAGDTRGGDAWSSEADAVEYILCE